jgi:WhiB family transcriptional regulator, redox-sensing transcriptional regulator
LPLITTAQHDQSQAAPTGGSAERIKEVAIVQLMALLDAQASASVESEDVIPCRINDAEMWFAESPADVEFAKSLCQACPVLEQCLAGALDRREPWGVWGGQLFIGGEVVARKRPRGRPRKTEIAA